MITSSMIVIAISWYLIRRVMPRIVHNRAHVNSSVELRRLRIGVTCLNVCLLVLIGCHLLAIATHANDVAPWVHPIWLLLLLAFFLNLSVPDELRRLEIKLRAREEAPDIEYRL